MKKNLQLILAAIIGSGITLGTYLVIFDPGDPVVKIEHIDRSPVLETNYRDAGRLLADAPVDFTVAAETVMPAVVHIKATQTYSTQSPGPNAQNPYRDFFGDDFFERFFGNPYQDRRSGPRAKVGTGSGVIVSEDGYIVTNNHVIEQADDIEVTLNDNRNYKASVIGTDPSTDLALIKVDDSGLDHLPFTNSDEVKVGEWVLAVGNPFNLTSTVTAGIVSAKARNINILRDRYAVESFIQTDAAINPGNSGGALVDLEGRLIGINTAIASPTGSYSGYGFAVPVNIVSKVVKDLIDYGVVQRGYLGVTIRSLDGNLAKERDLDITEGVLVDSVGTESAAEKAGIKIEDVIISVDGNDVKTASELQELIARKRPGDQVSVDVLRDEKKKSFDVTLRNREGDTKAVKKESETLSAKLGADFQTIDEKTARRLGIEGGVRVINLKAGKLRKQTGMREGFIITKIDGQPVNDAVELEEQLTSKTGGILLEGVYEDIPGDYYYGFGM
jgi:Do/DeqQ family serine protease